MEEKSQQKIGYARVSTTDQKFQSQIDALEKHGCGIIYTEKVSGSKKDRPELERCLHSLREGDTLVVTKLDRLGRSLKDLVLLMTEFQKRKVNFKCIDDPIDTRSATGEFFFHVMGAFAQLEKSLIQERTRAGLAAARKRGKYGGRPISIKEDKKEMAYQLYMKNDDPLTFIAESLGMSRMTVYRYIEKRNKEHAKATTIVS